MATTNPKMRAAAATAKQVLCQMDREWQRFERVKESLAEAVACLDDMVREEMLGEPSSLVD